MLSRGFRITTACEHELNVVEICRPVALEKHVVFGRCYPLSVGTSKSQVIVLKTTLRGNVGCSFERPNSDILGIARRHPRKKMLDAATAVLPVYSALACTILPRRLCCERGSLLCFQKTPRVSPRSAFLRLLAVGLAMKQ